METFEQMARRKQAIERRLRYEKEQAELQRLKQREKEYAKKRREKKYGWLISGTKKVGRFAYKQLGESGTGYSARRRRKKTAKLYHPRKRYRKQRRQTDEISYWLGS